MRFRLTQIWVSWVMDSGRARNGNCRMLKRIIVVKAF
jgi:hypothetical protein